MINKKGYLKIVEAFIAILLISGVLLFIIKSKNEVSKEEIGLKINELERTLLQELSENFIFRTQILNNQISIELNNFVSDRTPRNYEYQLAICGLDSACPLPAGVKYPSPDKEVFSNAISITTNTTTYQPKQLKMWMWGNK